MSSFRPTTRRRSSKASSPVCAGSTGRRWLPRAGRRRQLQRLHRGARARGRRRGAGAPRHRAPRQRYALDFAFRASRRTAGPMRSSSSMPTPRSRRICSKRLPRASRPVPRSYRRTIGVLNPQDSWRTRLMAIALASFHRVRSRARERLRLSCGIRGNGWCITHRLLREVPYRAYSLAEDIEYGIDLGLAGSSRPLRRRSAGRRA